MASKEFYITVIETGDICRITVGSNGKMWAYCDTNKDYKMQHPNGQQLLKADLIEALERNDIRLSTKLELKLAGINT